MENKRVVIVDDSRFIVKQLIKFYRDEMGFDVVAVGKSGEEAIELYRQHQPDLLSLDIVMENMNGLEAVETIIGEFPSATILMVSAVRTDEMLDCIAEGAKSYVEKPLQLSEKEFVDDFKETLAEVFKQ